MRISLDFDKTYTEDPKLWDAFIDHALRRDHDIRIVTFRSPDIPVEKDFTIPVHYTSYTPKKWFMEKLGLPIDVWIDDDPNVIVNESDWTEEDRVLWLIEHNKKLGKVA